MNSFFIYNLHATTFAIAWTPLSVLVALDQPLFFNFSKLRYDNNSFAVNVSLNTPSTEVSFT